MEDTFSEIGEKEVLTEVEAEKSLDRGGHQDQ